MSRITALTAAFNIVFVCLIALGCARPQYETAPSADQSQNKLQSICKASLPKEGVCLDITWESYPSEKMAGSLIVIAKSLNGEHLVSDFTNDLRVTLWMPSMGHGSSPVKVVPVQPGIFRIEKVFFIMRGDWEIRFQTPKDSAAWPLVF